MLDHKHVSILKLWTLGVILSVATVGSAQKVAVLGIQDALRETEYFQERALELRDSTDFQSLIEEGRELTTKIQDLNEKVRREADTLTEAEFSRLRRDSEEFSQDLQVVRNKVQAREQAFVAEMLETLQEDMEKAVEEIVTEREIDLLIDRQQVLVAKPAIDITSEVVVAIDKARNEN